MGPAKSVNQGSAGSCCEPNQGMELESSRAESSKLAEALSEDQDSWHHHHQMMIKLVCLKVYFKILLFFIFKFYKALLK